MTGRRGFCLTLLALGACGFEPVYAPGGSGLAVRGQIEAAAPTTPFDFAFVSQFEDRVGRAPGAPLLLEYQITTDQEGLAITADQEILRYNLTGRLRYSVRDRDSGAVMTSGVIDSFTAYSAIGTTVATRASESDAQIRLATILADRLVTDLFVAAADWGP